MKELESLSHCELDALLAQLWDKGQGKSKGGKHSLLLLQLFAAECERARREHENGVVWDDLIGDHLS